MARNEYFGGGGYAEDEFNGMHGAYSPEAILNALRESSGKSSGTPFESLLKNARDFSWKPTATPMRPVQPANGIGGTAQGPAQPLQPDPQGRGRIAGASGPQAPGGNLVPWATPQAAPQAPAATNNPYTPYTGGWFQTPDAAELRKDPSEAAKQYALMDPRLQGITGADVSAFRNWALSTGNPNVRIEAWWLQLGRPQQQAAAPTQPWGPSPTVQNVAPPYAPPLQVPPTAPQATPQGGTDYLANLDRALQASQSREAQNALRQFRSAGSAVGLENTGAYLGGQQELIGDLAARFGTQRAEAMLASSEAERARAFQGSESELDRQLQRYGIDVSSYTSRFNTQTSAGVQQAAAAMQYDLGLKGINVEQGRLEESIRNNTLGYNLGVGQQDLQRTLAGQTNQIDLFKLMADIGPDEVFRRLFGEQAAPGSVGYVP